MTAPALGAVCDALGPGEARCQIRHGHIGLHGGMDRRGEWRTW